MNCTALDVLAKEVIACRACPRLIRYIGEVARIRRRAYREWDYWGRPVPPLGDPAAKLLILGLAPAAHGANRTGRMFTGDRSGDFLFRALYQTGFASQPHSVSREDGLELRGAYISATVRCAPPDNKPLPEEMRNCRPFLERELDLLPLQAVVCLGKIAFDTYLAVQRDRGVIASRALYRFGHDQEYRLGPGRPILISSYHPSQQNTSTGKLTEKMLLAVFRRARKIVDQD